ncbi:HNH endonuclease domain-containing protein [Flammeovirga sp. EKP202]|uniref:HNH endonuclease domain-containing protein n=1 Tax=Flammeovirga sp. EKP202 TaxID=2770592 RepID=UPI00165F81FF|nr:HNH endonuclease domain-containing protein [Flammeovirga sp. EKP202]MBD0404407.1 hypothetical protein [Flammeovirga sp. EKP202]
MNRLSSNSNEAFQLISHILQKDSKSSSYKLALLRGIIEIFTENQALVYEEENNCFIPLGPLTEKWLFYYLPFVYHEVYQNSAGPIVFYQPLKELQQCYKGELLDIEKSILRDIKNGFPNPNRRIKYHTCIHEIAQCIYKNPMRYTLNQYFKGEYQFYQKRKSIPSLKKLDISKEIFRNDIHDHLGYIAFRAEVRYGLELFGSFLIGENSIINNWADLTLNFKKNKSLPFKKNEIVELLYHSNNIRSVDPPRSYYEKVQSKGELFCLWTLKPLKGNFETDHIIPWSFWKNNDIWNLVPASRETNNNKSAKIPSAKLLLSRKKELINIWQQTHSEYKDQFEREVALTLNIPKQDFSYEKIFEKLIEKVDYLIGELGMEKW